MGKHWCIEEDGQRRTYGLFPLSSENGGSKLRANILTRIQAHANAFLILDETNDCPYFLETRAQYVTCASLSIEDQSPGKGVCAHTCHILDDDNHTVRLFVCPVDTLGYVRERFRRRCLADCGTWAGGSGQLPDKLEATMTHWKLNSVSPSCSHRFSSSTKHW